MNNSQVGEYAGEVGASLQSETSLKLKKGLTYNISEKSGMHQKDERVMLGSLVAGVRDQISTKGILHVH